VAGYRHAVEGSIIRMIQKGRETLHLLPISVNILWAGAVEGQAPVGAAPPSGIIIPELSSSTSMNC
jgi:hypothetical protein